MVSQSSILDEKTCLDCVSYIIQASQLNHGAQFAMKTAVVRMEKGKIIKKERHDFVLTLMSSPPFL